jgi:hypothetical protein
MMMNMRNHTAAETDAQTCLSAVASSFEYLDSREQAGFAGYLGFEIRQPNLKPRLSW